MNQMCGPMELGPLLKRTTFVSGFLTNLQDSPDELVPSEISRSNDREGGVFIGKTLLPCHCNPVHAFQVIVVDD